MSTFISRVALVALLALAASACGPDSDAAKLSLTLDRQLVELKKGASQTLTITVARSPGFTHAVQLSPTSVRAVGFTQSLAPNPIPEDATTAVLTLSLSAESSANVNTQADIRAWDAERGTADPGVGISVAEPFQLNFLP